MAVALVKILLVAFRLKVLVVVAVTLSIFRFVPVAFTNLMLSELVLLAKRLVVNTSLKILVIAFNMLEKKLDEVALRRLDEVAKSKLVVAFVRLEF